MKIQASMIRTLINRSFKKSKGRNLVAILAIILTTMMFTTLFTLAQSMEQNMTEMYLRQSGTMAHTSCKQINDAQIEQIAAYPEVESYGKSIVVGLAENDKLSGRQVEIRYANDQYAKDSFAYPITGSMPQSKDEIALDTLTLERLGIPLELGQQVTLEWRRDLFSSEITSSTFTLCGWWEGNMSVYASMAWVSEAFALEACEGIAVPEEGQICGLRMMGVNFADSENIEWKMEDILVDCGLSELEFDTNMAYTAEMKYSIQMENLPMYIGMIFVFFAGYLIIFNVFQISVASDIQFYGKLKTLGMPKRQIKKIIYGQGNRLSLLGIPAGLMIGYLLGIVLVPALIATKDFTPTVSANPVIFIGSALFAYITVIVSCLLPAGLAGKISPMEALRYTDADSSVKRKVKKTKKGASLAGMAWANLWRNKRRTVMVICSLTLGLVLMSFFYAKNASFDVEKYLMDLVVADFQIDDATNELASGYDPQNQTISSELITDIFMLEGSKENGHLYSREVAMTLSEQACNNLRNFYTQDRLEEFASYDPSFPAWKEVYDSALSGDAVPVTVYGADGLILDAATSDNYILDGVYDAEKFASGKYVLAIGVDTESQDNLPTYSVGETLEIEGNVFTVMAVLRPLYPMVEGTSPVFDLPIVMPADVYTELWPDSNLRKFYFNVTDDMMEDASNLLTEYQQNVAIGMNVTSRQTMIEQYEAETRSSAVMGYAISIIVALVGILNFVNSMVTAIISRKKEFAMMQSVGMTKRQLRMMLIYEGIYYAGMTLVISYILGSITVGVIVPTMVAGGFSTFHFTLLPLAICTPVLIAFAVVIPYFCFKNLEKQSIVERLRMTD